MVRGPGEGRREDVRRPLGEAGCTVKAHDSSLLVRLPAGQSEQMLWEQAAAAGQQIRHLRPQRSTLEEVFLKAIDHENRLNLWCRRPACRLPCRPDACTTLENKRRTMPIFDQGYQH